LLTLLSLELLTTTNQLSDLINSRYQDFISLPDGLTGMDKVLEDIKLDHVEGDKLLGVGPNVASELKRRIELLDKEVIRIYKLTEFLTLD
jgi:hypothetical protein